MCRTIHDPGLAAQAARSGPSPWYFNLCKEPGVGTQRIELCLPGPKPGALTITRHPAARQTGAVDHSGIEPETFSLQGSCSAN
jgi:hypothetical protein